jgi:hypothetical protein
MHRTLRFLPTLVKFLHPVTSIIAFRDSQEAGCLHSSLIALNRIPYYASRLLTAVSDTA